MLNARNPGAALRLQKLEDDSAGKRKQEYEVDERYTELLYRFSMNPKANT